MTTAYRSPEGFHRHKCDHCGLIWEHRDKVSPDKGRCDPHLAGHECPACGQAGQVWQYLGDAEPELTTRPAAQEAQG